MHLLTIPGVGILQIDLTAEQVQLSSGILENQVQRVVKTLRLFGRFLFEKARPDFKDVEYGGGGASLLRRTRSLDDLLDDTTLKLREQ